MNLNKLKSFQQYIKKHTKLVPLEIKNLKLIGACDVSYLDNTGIGVLLIFKFPELYLLEETVIKARVNFPYIPGFLSFREFPILKACWKKVKLKPDVLLLDGQGIAHPRQAGIATHAGVLLDVPTIGCAKSKLIGEGKPPLREMESSPLFFKGKQIGWILKSKRNVKPIYISPGHKIDMLSALQVILLTLRGHRLPEPLRLAHLKTLNARAIFQRRNS